MAKRRKLTEEEAALEGKKATMKVRLHNYRYPRECTHVSGTFAIIVFEFVELLEGEIYTQCFIANGGIVGKGIFPHVEGGMDYIMTGTLKFDPEWGPQYEVEDFHLAYNLQEEDEQKKFLSFLLTENQVETLFTEFKDPIELLKRRDIEALTKVKGIGVTTANRLCDKYWNNAQNSRVYVELSGLGLTKRAIDALVNKLGSADIAIDTVKKNPYSLIKLVRGYGWERADRLALAQGIGRGSKIRCLAYMEYKLNRLAQEDGNSRLPVDDLLNELAEVCKPATKEQIAQWLREGTVRDQEFEQIYIKIKNGEKNIEYPTLYYCTDDRFIGLFSLRLMEREIADEITRLKDANCKWQFDTKKCEKIIQEVEAEQGYTYTHEQRRAIWNVLSSNVSILTGSSGCGKSSTLKPLIRIFQRYNISVAQCALSGRASSLLTEYTGLTGKTIHRLLGYLPDEERFAHSKNNPLLEDVIILDEASMVGEELFLSLISSIKSGAKLLMLGDTKQLPPISVGNILGDSIQSGYIPTTTLTIIHRQALKSGIISQAAQICEGKPIIKKDFIGSDIRGELKDFKIVTHADAGMVHAKVVDEFKWLYKSKGISADDIQIIVPVRSRGLNSCRYFNSEIQKIVNGGHSSRAVTQLITDNDIKFEVTYKPGDRIIVTKNNYHAKTIDGEETAIFNGNMGHILDLDNESMLIELPGSRPVIIPRDTWGDIGLSYAVTCHKCQGSQAPYVIVGLDNSSYPLLMREWLYTALTRAQKFCILVGQPTAINTATRVCNGKVKETWLKGELKARYLEQTEDI